MAEKEHFAQPSIPRFDGHYDHWSMLMENFMRSKEYWSVIETGVVESATEGASRELTDAQKSDLKELKLKDLKAKNYLFQAIDRAILETILSKESSKQIWDSMKKKYQGSERVKRAHLQALRGEFEVLHMNLGESVSDYFSRAMAIANKMRIHGDKIEDISIIEKILRSMTSKFDYVVCSIEESKDLDDISIDELMSSLLVHEQRMNKHIKVEEALQLQLSMNTTQSRVGSGQQRGEQSGDYHYSYNRGRGRGRGRARGHGRRPVDRSMIQCYRCNKYGHYSYECTTILPHEKEENSNLVEEEEELTLLMVHSSMEETHHTMWYLDTGASNHMCFDRSLFSELDESHQTTVRLGDDSKLPVAGKGTVIVHTSKDSQAISSVLYVPRLTNNLLSVGQLQEEGFEIIIRKGTCIIQHPDKGLIANVIITKNRMFPIYFNNDVFPCFSAMIKDEAWLWHLRYGHLNFNGLRTLFQRGMVHGLPRIDHHSQICEGCVVSKQHRDPFPRNKAWRAMHSLQLVHTDICGPISPLSNGKKRYFITFIDDFSRKTWVYILSEKSEAFSTFQSFKAMVEKEAGQHIKVLRSDRGGEYMSNEFESFCTAQGIKRQYTTSYTPQQNGVAERKNRTILNMVRSMLNTSHIPKNFWPEAVLWSIHLLNRCPTKSVQNMVPEEAWSGRRPSVVHLRVFGCIAYAHVPDVKRKKLDDKGMKCVLLGISEHSNGYRLYNSVTKAIIISRDVIFDEEKTWPWEAIHSDQHPLIDDSDLNDESHNLRDTEIPLPLDSTEQAPAEPTLPAASSPLESNTPSHPSQQRPERTRRKPAWMQHYEVPEVNQINSLIHVALFSDDTPLLFDDAVVDPKWRQAMNEEIRAIEKNNTWELTTLPKNHHSIGVKWLYKTKLNADGTINKYKARLVVKGYKHRFGIDYTEVFAPVARHDTIRLVVAMAAQQGWHVYQLDVKSAFLHGELNEQVYVDQPPGFVKVGHEEKVYHLKKALYGLKQAPRAWYSRIDNFFTQSGFQKCPHEPTLFIKYSDEGGKLLIVCLYVDDLMYTGNDDHMLKDFKRSMMSEFDMTDLGLLYYFLGLEVIQSSTGIFISQQKYAHEVLDKFEMSDCNPVNTPVDKCLKLTKDIEGIPVNCTLYKQIVGSLLYLCATRPDIVHGVSLLSRYMEHPTELHLSFAKRILRYLKGTSDHGILYKKGTSSLIGFTDSDYAGDVDDRKSTSGYVFLLGTGAVSWSSKKQPIVTLSTPEAEYVAAASCACQAIWLGSILQEFQFVPKGPLTIYCDNSSTIKLTKNPVLHGRCKHIDIRYHFLRTLVANETLEFKHCRSEDQVADIFTKPLKPPLFIKLRQLLGICPQGSSA